MGALDGLHVLDAASPDESNWFDPEGIVHAKRRLYLFATGAGTITSVALGDA